jgi:hypothetical protein
MNATAQQENKRRKKQIRPVLLIDIIKSMFKKIVDKGTSLVTFKHLRAS